MSKSVRRGGNMKICNMVREIQKDMTVIEGGYISKRGRRQLEDGKGFIEMISNKPYTTCKNVSSLKKMISANRKKILETLIALESETSGAQITVFNYIEKESIKAKEEKKKKINKLEKEARWLHKCLGMCCNRTYFT